MIDIYAIIRIPKAGSSSLEKSLKEALTPKHLFKIPMLANPDARASMVESIRAGKKKANGLWKSFHVLRESTMWRKIDNELVEGDIISGHIEYGSPQLNSKNVKYITIIRDPLERFISEYKWIRFGFEKKWPIQRLYHSGRPAASGKSIDYYLDFLLDHADIYKNPTTRFVTGSASHPDPYKHLLSHYWHFGILEKPADFAANFEAKTGLPFVLQHINHSPAPSQIRLTSTQLSKFERLHEADLALHQALRDKICATS